MLVLVAAGRPGRPPRALEAAGVETLAAASLDDGLRLLAARDVQTVLCEGGATLAGAPAARTG